MDSLNAILNSGTYGENVSRHNDNNSKIKQAITTLENVAIANKGYFDTLASLQAAFPSPKAGNIAYVANVASSTGYYIYNVVSGVWTATTTEAPAVGVAISNYAQHGYSSSPKTLKQVEDEIVQLAGTIKLTGNDNEYIRSERYKGVKNGNTYRVWVKNPNMDVSGVTLSSAYNILGIALYGVETYSIKDVKVGQQIDDYYDFTVPLGDIYEFGISIRATVGEEAVFVIEDITALTKVKADASNISILTGIKNDKAVWFPAANLNLTATPYVGDSWTFQVACELNRFSYVSDIQRIARILGLDINYSKTYYLRSISKSVQDVYYNFNDNSKVLNYADIIFTYSSISEECKIYLCGQLIATVSNFVPETTIYFTKNSCLLHAFRGFTRVLSDSEVNELFKYGVKKKYEDTSLQHEFLICNSDERYIINTGVYGDKLLEWNKTSAVSANIVYRSSEPISVGGMINRASIGGILSDGKFSEDSSVCLSDEFIKMNKGDRIYVQNPNLLGIKIHKYDDLFNHVSTDLNYRYEYISDKHQYIKIHSKFTDNRVLSDEDMEAIRNSIFIEREQKYYYNKGQIIGNFDMDVTPLPYTGSTGNDIRYQTIADIYGLYDDLMSVNSDIMTRSLLGYGTSSGVGVAQPDISLPIYEYIIKPLEYASESYEDKTDYIYNIPKICLTSGVHGREKVGVQALFEFCRNLLSNPDIRCKSLVNNFEFRVIPIVNPHSYNEVTRNNARDVNPARNMGYNWENQGGHDVGDKGTSPYSELESQILRDWLFGNRDAMIYLDCHDSQLASGADTIAFYSYSFSDEMRGIYSSLIRLLSKEVCSTYSINPRRTLGYLAFSQFAGTFAESYVVNGIKYSSAIEINNSFKINNESQRYSQMQIEIYIKQIFYYVLSIIEYLLR